MGQPISPDGFRNLKTEWERLFKEERPRLVAEIAAAAAQGDRSENAEYIYGKRRLREIDRRLRTLDRKIRESEVVDNRGRDADRIYFGAKVRLLRGDGAGLEVRIVGADEIDPERGLISGGSPLGGSLLGKSAGDTVEVRTPRGPVRYAIQAVEYD